MIRYHIDTDMGVDDGLALVVASRLLNSALSAVSTVFGNVPVQVATRNATIFRRLIRPDHKFAIMSGAERASDGHFRDARHVHGDDGLGGATADLGGSFLHHIDAQSEVSKLSAVAPIAAPDQEIVIIGLGPTTNIMHLVEYYGRQNVKRIVLMAGAFFDAGNITPYAEFNAHCDPFALIQLLNLGTPVTMVPLDVCRKIQLTRSTVRAYLDVSQSKLTKLIVKSHMKYMDFYYEREGIDGCFPHDTIAVLVAIMPQWFSHAHARIRVDTAPERRGATSLSFDDSSHVSVVFGGGLKKVRELLRTLRSSSAKV